MGWRLLSFYFLFIFVFYWLIFYGYFSYILLLLLVEGVMVIVFLSLNYIGEVYVLSLELMFLIMGMLVFEGVVGLCLLINNYRALGLNYYSI